MIHVSIGIILIVAQIIRVFNFHRQELSQTLTMPVVTSANRAPVEERNSSQPHRCLYLSVAPDVPSTIVRYAAYYENLVNHEIMKPKKNESGEFVIGNIYHRDLCINVFALVKSLKQLR